MNMSITMTQEASGQGTRCRERYQHDAVPRAVVNDDQCDELSMSEDEGEDLSMISSRSSMRDEKDHKRCGKWRRFWSLHKGLLLALLSCITQASGSIGVKMLAGRIPATEVATFRFAGYIFFSSVCLVYCKVSVRVTLKQLPWLLLRVTFGTFSLCFCYYAYQNIPVGDTTAILFSSPIFTGIFAWILLREKFTLIDVALAVLTVVGIVLIARPSFLFGDLGDAAGDGNTVLGVVAAVVGALFVSAVFVLMRKLGGIRVHPFTQVWFFGLAGTLMTSILNAVLGLWTVPKCSSDRFVLMLVTFLGFFTVILTTYAFKLEKATYVAVMNSNDVILAFLFEFAVFGTVPFWLSIIGVFFVMFISSLGITIKKWKALKSKEAKERKKNGDVDHESDNEVEKCAFDVNS